jgi:glutaredoxin-like YruB-family protein
MSKQNTSGGTAKVEIFTTPFCVYCKMAKEYFRENNIPYVEYDVSKDIAKQQEMIAKTHQFGVPVIIIDGEIVIGFDRTRINQLLGI